MHVLKFPKKSNELKSATNWGLDLLSYHTELYFQFHWNGVSKITCLRLITRLPTNREVRYTRTLRLNTNKLICWGVWNGWYVASDNLLSVAIYWCQKSHWCQIKSSQKPHTWCKALSESGDITTVGCMEGRATRHNFIIIPIQTTKLVDIIL